MIPKKGKWAGKFCGSCQCSSCILAKQEFLAYFYSLKCGVKGP